MTRTVAVLTTNRAEYGQLYWLLKAIEKNPRLRLKLLVSGAHLSGRFGRTERFIRGDGFKIDARVPMSLTGDRPVDVLKDASQALRGFALALGRLKPDVLVILGDRYESLAAAFAALVMRVPVAHLCGGDVTEGVIDESIRHAITKMAHLHFATNADSARRLRRLGEHPRLIFNVGHPALDRLRRLPEVSRGRLEAQLGFRLRQKNLLVTFHPTADAQASERQLVELLAALETLGEQTGVLITHPNPDSGSAAIRRRLDAYARPRPRVKVFRAMGSELYLNAMRHVDAVVGNSSSGVSEAPSVPVASVNIGDRQKGRLMARSVVCCAPSRQAIAAAIRKAWALDVRRTRNPYGSGDASSRIARILAEGPDPRSLLKKSFYEASS